MNIRHAIMLDMPFIKEIFDKARAYMRLNGNMNQWPVGYPHTEVIAADIEKKHCYVCEYNGQIVGVFTLFPGPEHCYSEITGTGWLNDNPYGVIHRIAVGDNRKGVASYCISFCEKNFSELRIDTHEDNVPMKRFLTKHGFIECGTVIIENGEERIAFHKSIER